LHWRDALRNVSPLCKPDTDAAAGFSWAKPEKGWTAMKIIREPHEMQQTALTLRDKAIRIGLCDMGAFHDGHVS
jgi:hypothetical protein